MLIRPLSDIHLEFADYTIVPLDNDKETTCVLAGDITVAAKKQPMETFVGFIQRACAQFKHVVYIMGNHEHYSGAIHVSAHKIRQALEHFHLYNFHFLDNSDVILDDVAFIGTTLWTGANNNHPMAGMLWEGMSDSRVIRYGTEGDPYRAKFQAKYMITEHLRSKKFLFAKIDEHKQQGRKVVCVVHHGVTEQSIADEFKDPRNGSLNMFFVEDLTYPLMDSNPDLVIHGHVHNAFDYYLDRSQQFCNTRIVCNPRGYAGYESTDHIGFDPVKVVSV
jgi:DNA repair exonuclease SbcCD nuclease subunit